RRNLQPTISTAAISDVTAGYVFSVSAPSGRHRYLFCDAPVGRTAHVRDWRPHGIGRAPNRCVAGHDQRGITPRWLRSPARTVWCAGTSTVIARSAIWYCTERPYVIRHRNRLVGGHRCVGCYVPARRASRVDPIVALRHE